MSACSLTFLRTGAVSGEDQIRFPAVSKTVFLSVLAVGIAIAVTVFDLSMPLGVAGGVPYVAMVMLGLWYPRREGVLYLAILGSVLTLLGYYFSPPGGVPWVVFVNRMLALFAIWVTALLIYNYAKLMADRRKMARAVEQSSVGIMITDTNGIIEYVNPKIVEMTGYKESEILYKTPRVFKSGLTQPEIYSDLWTTIMAGNEWHSEVVNKHKNGRLFWEYLKIFPVRGRTGEIRNFVAIKEDITDRKRAEEEIVAAKNDAENANEAKSTFLANMSHELRTPLNAIMGFSETMQMKVMGPLGNKKYEEYVAFIHNSAGHLRQLIDQILDLSKVEAGKQEVKETEIDVHTLFNTSLSLVNELARKAEIRLDGSVDDNVPRLLADERMMKQVLLNILSNAIKFTPKGGIVQLTAYLSDDDRLTMEVSDTGIGISADDYDKAFSVFGQIENIESRSHEGSGLGLPISRRLIELHKGELDLESTLGEGTVVKITFPADRAMEMIKIA